MKEVSYQELIDRVGDKFLVVDTLKNPSDLNIKPQKCTLSVDEYGVLFLENEEYIFEYDRFANCLYAVFYVYEE